MILCINTIQENNIMIALKNNKGLVAQKNFKVKYKQAEKLLPLIDKLLKQNKSEIKDIKKIQVANQGESGTSFTALRIGIVIANALGYAIGAPVEEVAKGCKKLKEITTGYRYFKLIKPIYSKEPNIT